MGLLLSILFSYAGAIEFMFIVRDIVHRVGLHHEKMKFNKNQSNVTSTLHEIQEDLRKSIQIARIELYETDCIHSMADGIQYIDGYRIPSSHKTNSAIASIEPSHIVEANNVVTSITNENQSTVDVTPPPTDLQCRCSISKITDSTDNEIAIDLIHLNGNDDYVVPSTHFDEYTHDNSYNYDSETKISSCQQQQQQQQQEHQQQSKSFKTYSNTSNHIATEERRRSKDIDDETNNPWGELRPESFHDADLWSRERAMSIAENDELIGCVDEKSNKMDFKQNVKALTNASPMTTLQTIESSNNGISFHAKKNENTFGVPDETYGEKIYDTEVSNEIPSSLPHCFDEVKSKCDSRTEQMLNIPEILVDGLDLDEFSEEDCTFDGIHIELDKHQFKDYLEKPNRLRHSSYNYDIDEDNDDDLNEFSIVRTERSDEAANMVNVNESIDTKSPMQSQKNRKPNMFAASFNSSVSSCSINNNNYNDNTTKIMDYTPDNNNLCECEYRPFIRITTTEDERVEHFLQEEQIHNTHRSDGDILIKSKTTQMFECRDECISDGVDLYESRANSPSSVLGDVARRESMVSDVGSEPIQFECKHLENPNYIYNRKDSSTSNKSNTLYYERSQSHLSELEYIKGRDDWKDDYARCSISEEVDSDNYHHLRRHSEAADTLEYIRGREDWLQWNSAYRNNRPSLAQIFEAGEPKFLIQDEIDSDEYHHNFFQHEYVTDELGAQQNKSSKFRKPNAVVATNFEQQSVTENVASILSCNEITVATNLNNVHNGNPNAMPNAIMFDNGKKIDVVIEDLIKHDTIDNDDIEITVWDLTPESHKNNPFIFISEPPTDNRDSYNDESNLDESNQSIDSLHPDSAESVIFTDSSPSSFNENANPVSNSSGAVNEFMPFDNQSFSKNNECSNGKSQCETNKRPQTLCDDEKEIKIEIESSDEQKEETRKNIRAKSERIDLITSGLLNPKEQKPRRTLSFENVEDLIEQCSNGPWFHK